MKKFVSIALVLCMVLAFVPSAFATTPAEILDGAWAVAAEQVNAYNKQLADALEEATYVVGSVVDATVEDINNGMKEVSEYYAEEFDEYMVFVCGFAAIEMAERILTAADVYGQYMNNQTTNVYNALSNWLSKYPFVH